MSESEITSVTTDDVIQVSFPQEICSKQFQGDTGRNYIVVSLDTESVEATKKLLAGAPKRKFGEGIAMVKPPPVRPGLSERGIDE